jgi:hypothetical protein
MYANFDDERYRERNKVETAFSVLKRRFGEELKARKYWYQVKEIKIKVILHNLTKAVQTVVIVVVWKEFNRANFFGGASPEIVGIVLSGPFHNIFTFLEWFLVYPIHAVPNPRPAVFS